MISLFLPRSLVSVLGFIGLCLLITVAFSLMIPFILLKLLLPIPAWRSLCTEILIAIANAWVGANGIFLRSLYPIDWRVEINGTLDPKRSWLLICNHQSWVDIILLFDVLHGRAPFPRFFLKDQLKYVPIIGQACWALDFPFMKRHTKESLKKNPALRDQDLETTRRMCAKYRERPATVVNFLEGTRFTEAKRVSRGSPYRHLLRPKSAGMSFALNAMGDQFAGIIDVSIAYQPSRHSLVGGFLRGEQNDLVIHIDVLPIPTEYLGGDYQADAAYRTRFQQWINTLWTRKDKRLDTLAGSAHGETRPHTV